MIRWSQDNPTWLDHTELVPRLGLAVRITAMAARLIFDAWPCLLHHGQLVSPIARVLWETDETPQPHHEKTAL